MESLITCSCVNSICSLINYWSFDVRTLALSCTEIFIHSITMIMNSLSTFNYMVDRWDFWYLDRLQKYNYMYIWLHVWKKTPLTHAVVWSKLFYARYFCPVNCDVHFLHTFQCILPFDLTGNNDSGVCYMLFCRVWNVNVDFIEPYWIYFIIILHCNCYYLNYFTKLSLKSMSQDKFLKNFSLHG